MSERAGESIGSAGSGASFWASVADRIPEQLARLLLDLPVRDFGEPVPVPEDRALGVELKDLNVNVIASRFGHEEGECPGGISRLSLCGAQFVGRSEE